MTTTLLVAVLLAGTQAPTQPPTAQELPVAEAVACGPRAVYERPPAGHLAIAGTLADGATGMYAPWHRLVVNAGSDKGVRAGQQYFVRRITDPYEDKTKLLKEHSPLAVVTAGWVRIDAVEPERSVATVVHGCGGIVAGDYLEPFELPTLPNPLAEGTPDYGDAARVLFGGERARLEGTGRLLVIDHGSKHGIKPGQHFTIFRQSAAGPNIIIAKAIALEVAPETTMIMIEEIRDAVYGGDKAAPHR